MTIKSLISQKSKELASVLTDSEAVYIMKLFVVNFLNITNSKLLLKQNDEANNDLINYIQSSVEQLKKGEPFQYVLGKENFYGFDFKVNKNVLIPRPETEELVELVYNTLQTKSEAVIIDIGTGSGCISISLNKLLPKVQIVGVDVSEEALKIARKNNELLKTNTNFKTLNILKETEWNFESKFDAIVSNPPYIPNKEKSLMHANVLDFEPHLALFVEDDEALIFYEKIADFSIKYMKEDGFLFFECNEYNALDVKEMLKEKAFVNIELFKDLSGKDRMIKAQLK